MVLLDGKNVFEVPNRTFNSYLYIKKLHFSQYTKIQLRLILYLSRIWSKVYNPCLENTYFLLFDPNIYIYNSLNLYRIIVEFSKPDKQYSDLRIRSLRIRKKPQKCDGNTLTSEIIQNTKFSFQLAHLQTNPNPSDSPYKILHRCVAK